jgi:asparagine synthase (glutamine-hydrolysing)
MDKATLDNLLEKIRTAMHQTLPQKIGVAFSGGVDSTLVAKICSQIGFDVTLLTIGFEGSHDIEFSKKISQFLGLPHEILKIDPGEFGKIAKKIRKELDTDNLSWNENCIAFYHIARLAKSLGLGFVVTANGIDELFCGYDGYRNAIKQGEEKVMELMDTKLKNELTMMGEINCICSEFGVKIIQPLLSDEFIKYAKSIPVSLKIHDENDLQRKHIIRNLALQIGVPEISANKRKKALQYGSLIHKELKRV